MNGTATQAKRPSPMVVCDLCKADFALSKDALVERQVTLEREGFPDHSVLITFLTCPKCGKQYPVVMDDETTLPLLEESKALLTKRWGYLAKGKEVPKKLQEKANKIRRKLGFHRRKLADKYNGSFYQTADGKEQLEYRYHER